MCARGKDIYALKHLFLIDILAEVVYNNGISQKRKGKRNGNNRKPQVQEVLAVRVDQ